MWKGGKKDWPEWLRKEQVWFTDKAYNQYGIGEKNMQTQKWNTMTYSPEQKGTSLPNGGSDTEPCIWIFKKGVVRWDLEGPISAGYLAHCSHPLFHERSHRVFGVLLYAISEFCDTDFAGQVVYKPWVLSMSFWGAHANYSYFNSCSRLRASAASACNWVGYCTFYVVVFKCMY